MKTTTKECKEKMERYADELKDMESKLIEQDRELRRVKRLLLAARDLGHVIDNLLSEDAGQGRYS